MVVLAALVTFDADVEDAGEEVGAPSGLVLRGGPEPIGFSPLPGALARQVAVNWTAVGQSNLWTDGDVQYAVWVDPDGAPIIGRRAVGGKRWQTFDLSTIPGDPFGPPTIDDPHEIFAVAVDANGHVHVAGNMHASRLRYARSAWPGSINRWETPTMVGTEEGTVTYPVFASLPDGELLFFYRDGTSTAGDLVLNALTPGASDWHRVGIILAGAGIDAAPYPQHIAVDGRGRIHLVHTWRTGPGAEGNRVVSYVTSPDGGRSWETVDGSPLATPIGIAPDAVAFEVPDDLVVVNNGAADVDERGRPWAAFRVRGPQGQRRPILLLTHDDRGWRADDVAGTESASGRPMLVAGDAQVLLLWPADRERDSALVMAAEVSDGNAADDGQALLAVPSLTWEPTIDRRAVGHGMLQMLVPTPDNGEGLAAVVSYRLQDVLRGRRRHRGSPASWRSRRSTTAGAATHCRSASHSATPRATMAAPHSSMNRSRWSTGQRSQDSARLVSVP